MPPRPRILFVAEAVTLAHVARPAALAASLDPARYDVRIACADTARRFLGPAAAQAEPLRSIAAASFAQRLAAGRPVYTLAELRDYFADDLALFERVQPDLVVGDFRLSLSVSARLAGVPYLAISNAYWSPWAADRALPLPVLPWTRWVPLALAQRGFDLVRPLVLAPHCRPLQRLRRAHGLPPLPADLRHVYTDADRVLYADDAALFPLRDAPAHHRHLGPVPWSPPLPLPPWWPALPAQQDLAYVTMGSSGPAHALPLLVAALRGLGLGVVVATAGAPLPVAAGGGTGVWAADYLPGELAAARARLVVCNGGAPTAQQALAAGAPVLGICSNMDQFLHMRGLAAHGLGRALRADRLSARAIAGAAAALLAAPRPTPRPATALRERFTPHVEALLATRRAPARAAAPAPGPPAPAPAPAPAATAR
jgi:UDP:flavonoid glycosyltransferase YjiC (YdhE family)